MKWKQFNDYEDKTASFKKHVKDSLKREINNIATDLAVKREADFKATFLSPKKYVDTELTTYNRSNSNWRVPAVEAIERNFHETARYFSNGKEGRTHGVKLVPPPLASSVNQLIEEKKYSE